MLVGEPPRGPHDGAPKPMLPPDLAPEATDLELVCEIWSGESRASRDHAIRAQGIAALARRRRIEADAAFGPRGGPGVDARAWRQTALADVSEAFVPELALILACTESEAESAAVEAVHLTTKLLGTWSALYEGRISIRKMQALVDLLGPATPETCAAVEARLLGRAADWTVPQLRAAIRRELARLEREALEQRRAEAEKRADVRAYPTGDGRGQFVADMSYPDSVACRNAVDEHARRLRADGDTRPIGVLRAEVTRDLILRPWEARPPVTAVLTIHAPLPALDGDDPAQPACEVDGEVVSAAQCRQLLGELGILGVERAPAGGCVQVAVGDPRTGRLITVATRRELARAAGGRHRRRRTRRGRPIDVSATEPEGPGLRPPPVVTGYRPSAAQRRFVTVRDRTCRMPGCRRPPGRSDLDHATAHADGGETACWNLCCLCKRHHRIKTFLRDWSFRLLPDGRLVVRTPSGVTRESRPPGWCYDPEPDPPWLEDTAPPDPLRR
jgi:hypothetical protein